MTKELKEQIHEYIYNLKVPTLGFSRQDLFNIAMEYAEPREKRIAEFEQKLEQTEKDLADYQFNYPTIKELQKEIAELKGLVNQYKASKCSSISLVNRNMIMFDQLTKAKELLKRCYDNYIYLQPLRNDIEQFLKDGEVEK